MRSTLTPLSLRNGRFIFGEPIAAALSLFLIIIPSFGAATPRKTKNRPAPNTRRIAALWL